jgi:DNA repair exonuclease SbcCD ATPase subunit
LISGGQTEELDKERLATKREDNIKDLKEIKKQAENIEGITRREDPDIATIMRNFQKDLQRENLEQNLEETKNIIRLGWFLYAQIQEREIQDSINRLRGQVRKLEDILPMTEEEQINRSLNDIRELLQKYNEIEEIARQQLDSQRMARADQLQRQAQTQNLQSGGQNGVIQSEREQREGIARLERQIDQMQQRLDEMRRGNTNQNLQSALQALRTNLSRLNNTGVLLDEAGLEYFKKNVYNPLSQLELQLVRELDEIEMDRKLHGARRAEVPPQYRKVVEQYYETISKSKSGKKEK